MKYLDKNLESLKNNSSSEVLFNKDGKEVNGTQKVFAKIIKKEKSVQYLITTYNNQIYDPMGINSNRERYLDTKLKNVSKDTFDFYMIYLQTNNSIYLTRANRRFINE